jgi:hypothetical protein
MYTYVCIYALKKEMNTKFQSKNLQRRNHLKDDDKVDHTETEYEGDEQTQKKGNSAGLLRTR